MRQNPDYFPGYYTADRKIDIQVMDRMLLERCLAWILAADSITQEAALDEYVDTVISLIELDGANPRHRYDVQEQALSTINVLVNQNGRNKSSFANQETRMYMREQFLKRLTERLMDTKYGNSYIAPTPEINQRRTQLRQTFQTILDVDPSIFPAASVNADAQSQISADVKEPPLLSSHILIEIPDRHKSSEFLRLFSNEIKNKKWKIYASLNESGRSATLEIFPVDLRKIQRKAKDPEAALREVLQPVEDFLSANGYKAGSVIKDDPRWLTTQWSANNEAGN
jgi:hypothetical protein